MEDTGVVIAECGGYVLVEGRGWIVKPTPAPEPTPEAAPVKSTKSKS